MAAIVLVLLLAGLILLYSTSAYNGSVKFHDAWYYVKKQGFATLVGLMGMVIVSRIDYHCWSAFAVPGYLAAVALSVAVMLFGDEYNGSKRWLSFGPFSFQPSEFSKVAVIIFLAWLISRYAGRLDRFRRLLLTLIPVLPIAGLVGASNLSTALIILGIAVVLIFVSSAWNGLPSGVTRRNMKKAIRRSRGCMPSGAGAYSAGGSGTACRSWDSFRKPRMI